MSLYEDFLTEVLPYMHDCPDIVAINAIRNASIEFCEKSHWLLYEHWPVSMQANLAEYELDLPDDTVVTRVIEASINGRPLDAVTPERLSQIFGAWREATGTPSYITMLTKEEVTVVPRPIVSSVNAMKLIVAIQPSRASTTVDDSIYERWAETIAAGARSRLYDTANQPYTDQQAALLYRGKFMNGVNEAKRDRTRGFGVGAQRMRPTRVGGWF